MVTLLAFVGLALAFAASAKSSAAGTGSAKRVATRLGTPEGFFPNELFGCSSHMKFRV